MGKLSIAKHAFFICVLFLAGCAPGEGAKAKGDFILVYDNAPGAVFVITPEQAEEIEASYIASSMIEDFNNDLYECAECRLPVLETEGGGANVIINTFTQRGTIWQSC